MACKCVSKKVSKIILCVTLPLLAFSIVILALFPSIYESQLQKELTLSKGSLLTSIWLDIPLPIYEKVYFFNITNKEAFLTGSEPLNVTEVGPYTYKSKWVKSQPSWNDNDTVTYREIRTYQFLPDKSVGTEDDVVNTLNGPMIIAASIAKDYNINLRILLSILLGIVGEEIVIQRSVRQLVYEGYEDPIIKYAPILKPDIPFKNGIFSWLYGKNNTDDGLFTSFTGADNSAKLNILNNWNGNERLNFWKGNTCNMLNGTNIEVGPPIQDSQETYTFFQSIFCRSITLNYTEDQTHLGILSKRFRPTYEIFANSTENPDNYCFEVDKEHPSGVLDISPCQFGAPVFISFPHFYMADHSYLDAVKGLNPDDEEHGSHVDVEIITGVTIHAVVRFQLNVLLNKVEGILQTYNVTEGLFPILWVELNLQLDQHMADFLKSHLNNPKIIAYTLLGVLTGLSFILSVIFMVILCASETQEDDDCLIDAVDKDSGNAKNSKTGYVNASCVDNDNVHDNYTKGSLEDCKLLGSES